MIIHLCCSTLLQPSNITLHNNSSGSNKHDDGMDSASSPSHVVEEKVGGCSKTGIRCVRCDRKITGTHCGEVKVSRTIVP